MWFRILAVVAGVGLFGCSSPVSETLGSTSSSSSGTGATTTGGTSGTHGSVAASTSGTSSGASAASTSGTGNSSSTASSTNGATNGSSGNGSTGGNSGDCSSSVDCYGAPCVELSPGGFRTCQDPPESPEPCSGGGPGQDLCCPDSNSCPNGEACVLGPVIPFCGGIPVNFGNVCAVDECSSDADCAAQAPSICAPAGTLGREVRSCLPAACKLDSDCSAQPGGRCEPAIGPCCGSPSGLFCIYPNGGCRSGAECQPGYSCVQANGISACTQGGVACPG